MLERIELARPARSCPGNLWVDVEENDTVRRWQRTPCRTGPLVGYAGDYALGEQLVVIRVDHGRPAGGLAHGLVAKKERDGREQREDQFRRVLPANLSIGIEEGGAAQPTHDRVVADVRVVIGDDLPTALALDCPQHRRLSRVVGAEHGAKSRWAGQCGLALPTKPITRKEIPVVTVPNA